MGMDSLFDGYCPDDVEDESTTTYCQCQTGMGDNCGPNNYYTDCSPPLKNKKGKRRGTHYHFMKVNFHKYL